MTIHSLFSETEQDIINFALIEYLTKCQRNANSAIKGYGNAKELDKKEQWRTKAQEIEELQNKIVELTF